MKVLKIALSVLLSLVVSYTYASAEDLYSSSFKPCSKYSSPSAFVRESTIYCLKQSRGEICEREAKKYFEYCGFDGKYSKLSRKAVADLFKLLLLGKAQNLTNVAAK